MSAARALCVVAAAWWMAALPLPLSGSAVAQARTPGHDTGSRRQRPDKTAPDAGVQPLLSPAAPGASDGEEAAAAGRPREDPLVSNGLGSPACGSPLGGDLAPVNRRDCETSGFTATGAPTGNFGLDVHIDTGLVPLNGASLLSTVQNLFVAPLWYGLVWLVHALVAMLEWSFALNLVEGATSRSLQAFLAAEGRVLTTPFLTLALSIAAVLVAYHGLVRRRVGQTLGETLAMIAMMAGGTWLMVDPAGTVGALTDWSGEAGLGTLAVAARGTPASPGRALAQSMSAVFAATVEAPWCYLEFGNVGWCRDRSRQERSLRLAGLRLAGREDRESRCAGRGSPCDGEDARTAASARLLREAQTNGEEFLAFPPNGPERNSINDSSSLLRAICRSSDPTGCVGPAASEAEFRTNAGTWPRVAGLLLIVIGLLGMLLLLGYIAMRLLLAAILSVFYLLLTPGVVLIPVLGEAGRGAFRAWATRLFGAVVAKLVFAFLLGAVLGVMAALDELEGLGWWVDWMLLTAFWWGAFLKRHEILATARGTGLPGTSSSSGTFERARRRHERRVERRDAKERRNNEREEREQRQEERKKLAGEGQHKLVPAAQAAHAAFPVDEQAYRLASTAPFGAGAKRSALARVAASGAQLERIRRARPGAVGRRAVGLALREDRVGRSLSLQHEELRRSEEAAAARRGRGPAQADVARNAAFLDRQAVLPSLRERRTGQHGRDYAALSGLVGQTPLGYAALDPQSRRKARADIDRELSARRTERGLYPRGSAERPGAVGAAPRSRSRAPGAGGAQGTDEFQAPERQEAAVMRDARAVAEGRKRKLGIGNP